MAAEGRAEPLANPARRHGGRDGARHRDRGALAEMLRVLRPGGRVALGMGFRVPAGTETHQAMGGTWEWSEADARRLVEEAGFEDVSVSYAAMNGDGRLERALDRLVKSEDMRIVRATKAG